MMDDPLAICVYGTIWPSVPTPRLHPLGSESHAAFAKDAAAAAQMRWILNVIIPEILKERFFHE